LTQKNSNGIINSVMEEYTCPNCKNPIYDEDALLCHFCGGSLQRATKGFIGQIRYSNKQYALGDYDSAQIKNPADHASEPP